MFEGFSARKIEKFVISCYSHSFLFPESLYSDEDFLKEANEFIKQNEQKLSR